MKNLIVGSLITTAMVLAVIWILKQIPFTKGLVTNIING